jgi:hypothetical protein
MHPSRTRHITTLVGAALALAVGSAAPAIADPPSGHGNGNPPSSAPGQAKQTASPAPTTTAPASPSKPTPAPTHTPPGQAKKSSGAPGSAHSNGKGHANGAPHSTGKGHTNSTGKGQAANPGKGAKGAGHNPPGNNGTVKIHSLAGDPGHHNVAHPGCSFVVDFWGFDQGQTMTVSFTGQAPTGMGTPVTLEAPDGTSITSPDPAGGGNDPDGELAFTATAADLSVLGPPAKQGYHLRLTVSTGQGGGYKYKVFWVTPCAAAAPAATPTAGPAAGNGPILATSKPAVRSGHLTAVRQRALSSTPVLDTAHARHITGRLNQASPPLSSLPFTGADIASMIAAGAMTVAAGVLLTLASRRQRRRAG